MKAGLHLCKHTFHLIVYTVLELILCRSIIECYRQHSF